VTNSDKYSSILRYESKCGRKIFYRTGIHLIKLFWCKITHALRKLDHFSSVSNICLSVVKRSSLQKRTSKLMAKKFYETGLRREKSLMKFH